jgi:hypothetical protein
MSDDKNWFAAEKAHSVPIQPFMQKKVFFGCWMEIVKSHFFK